MTEGRIIKGVGGIYTVACAVCGNEDKLYKCTVRGVFRQKKLTPVVGDNVILDILDEHKQTATIVSFKSRKTELIRPRVANVDQAVIVFAAESPSINPDMLDRMIILTEKQNLEVIVCINKVDLTDSYIPVLRIYEKIGYKTAAVSAKGEAGFEALKQLLRDKVSVFAGPSGVGKSSIVNRLLPCAIMETGALSVKIDRGKHTTRHAELIDVQGEKNTYIVDSPGFTSVSLEHILPQELAGLFREFAPFAGRCRFSDCNHINEPDCAVKEQVCIDIDEGRYNRYVSLFHELADVRRGYS